MRSVLRNALLYQMSARIVRVRPRVFARVQQHLEAWILRVCARYKVGLQSSTSVFNSGCLLKEQVPGALKPCCRLPDLRTHAVVVTCANVGCNVFGQLLAV